VGEARESKEAFGDESVLDNAGVVGWVATTGDDALVGNTELIADGEEVSALASFRGFLRTEGSYGLARFFTVIDFCAGFRWISTGKPFQPGAGAEELREWGNGCDLCVLLWSSVIMIGGVEPEPTTRPVWSTILKWTLNPTFSR